MFSLLCRNNLNSGWSNAELNHNGSLYNQWNSEYLKIKEE